MSEELQVIGVDVINQQAGNEYDVLRENGVVNTPVIESVRNPAYTDMSKTRIVCDVKWGDRDDYMPFIASADDVVGIGRELFAACTDGLYGAVKTVTQAQFEAQELNQVKTAKSAEIDAHAQMWVDVNTGAGSTPAFELTSWTAQGDEAKAWSVNKAANTPIIAQIAAERGVPLDLMRQKVLDKRLAYEAVVGRVVGRRQKLQGQLKAAKTLADVEKIIVNYD